MWLMIGVWSMVMVMLLGAGFAFGFRNDWVGLAWVSSLLLAIIVGYGLGTIGQVVKMVWFRG